MLNLSCVQHWNVLKKILVLFKNKIYLNILKQDMFNSGEKKWIRYSSRLQFNVDTFYLLSIFSIKALILRHIHFLMQDYFSSKMIV